MINKKSKSEFTKNVLTLMTGTTIAQVIPIAISPILTRIYTPEDFGLFGLFLALTAILGTIVNGKYELALMLPKKDEDAINIFALGILLNIVISVFIFLIIFLFQNTITKLIGREDVYFLLFFIPVSTLLLGFFNMLNYYNTRKKFYKDIAKATIIKSVVMSLTQLILGYIKSGITGLIAGDILSKFFSNYKLLKNIISNRVLISKINIKKMIALLKKYKSFPIHNLPSSLADILTLQLPFIFIPKIYNLTVSGYFVLVQNVISIPSALIGKSISQVFFQSMSESKNNNLECMPILINTLKKLLIISLPVSVLIYIFSPLAFEIIFGKDWKVAGEIAQYFAFIFFIRFIVSTVSVSFSVTMNLKLLAKWQYSYLITSLILFSYILFYKIDLYDFIIFFVFHEIVLYLIYLYLILKSVDTMDKQNKKANICVE